VQHAMWQYCQGFEQPSSELDYENVGMPGTQYRHEELTGVALLNRMADEWD